MIRTINKEMASLQIENSRAFGRWLVESARALAHAFRVLQHIQYGQPWNGLDDCGKHLSDAGPAAWR